MDRREELRRRVREFTRARGWGRFHAPKNLAMAMVKEAAEVVEIFQWLTPAQSRRLSAPARAALADELADTYVYLSMLADACGVDLVEAALAKMDKNEKKYPAPHVRGVTPPRRKVRLG
ncbi:MAG: nucleotide pyrophosphohydrolase [Elusimicrobia bacterium]|nr:nucleotide pyrophosphohydrolase [Elusimicrobiota bacterium]